MHWFVVASQKEARIFVKEHGKRNPSLLKSFENPLAGAKKRDLIRKKAGRNVKSIGKTGTVSFSEPKRHDPHDEAVNQYARDLSRYLEKERQRNSFDDLTIIAEPNLIGKIRHTMGTSLIRYVSGWIKKDLQKLPRLKLFAFLNKTAAAQT